VRQQVEYRPVQLGPVIDGLRVVQSGLAPRDIVVNGLQRVRPGAQVAPQRVAMGTRDPVRTQPCSPAIPPTGCRQRGTLMNISNFFIERPIFAGVISAFITIAGLIALFRLPISEYPGSQCRRPWSYTLPIRGESKVIADTGSGTLEQAIVGVEDMLYMSSTSTMDGSLTLTVSSHRRGYRAPRSRCRTVWRRRCHACPWKCAISESTRSRPRPISPWCQTDLASGRYDSLYLRNYAVLNIRRAGTVCRAWAMCRFWRRRLLDAGVARSAEACGAQSDAAMSWRDPRAERPGRGRAVGAPPSNNAEFQIALNAAGRLTDEQQFRDIIVKTGADGQVVQAGRYCARRIGRAGYGVRSLLDNKPSLAIPVFQSPVRTRWSSPPASARRWRSSRKTFRRAWTTAFFMTHAVRAPVDRCGRAQLLEAVALVVLVVILFLQTWRASLIPLIAVRCP